MQETIDSAKAAASTLFLGHNGEWWDSWLIAAAIFASLGGMAIAVTTTGSIVSHKREAAAAEQELDRFKSDAEAKISAAEAVGKTAQADVAKANAQIAAANERAASLERDAAQARAEQERLKQSVVWRSISREAGTRMVRKLSTRKASITVAVVLNDPEAMSLASQLSKVLDEAGWHAVAWAPTWGNWLPLDVRIYGDDAETVNLLRQAFSEAGLPFRTDPPPRKPDMSIDFETPLTTAVILVGSKIGPF